MTRKRRVFGAVFKAKVALAAVRGDKTISELAGQYAVHGNLVRASDIHVDNMSVYGAYEKVGQLPAGVHYQLEDDGVLPDGATDGGHHDDAAMVMHLAMANHM